MKPLKYILPLIVAFTACTKVLEIDEPTERQLVVNAEPMAGHQAFVNFSYTRFFLDDNNEQPVTGGTVTLIVNGTPYSADSVRHCNYFFPYTSTQCSTA